MPGWPMPELGRLKSARKFIAMSISCPWWASMPVKIDLDFLAASRTLALVERGQDAIDHVPGADLIGKARADRHRRTIAARALSPRRCRLAPGSACPDPAATGRDRSHHSPNPSSR